MDTATGADRVDNRLGGLPIRQLIQRQADAVVSAAQPSRVRDLRHAVDTEVEVVAGKVAVDFHLGAHLERYGHLQPDTVFAEIDEARGYATGSAGSSNREFQPLHRRPF